MKQIDLSKVNWRNIIITCLVIFALLSLNKCHNDSKTLKMYENEKKIDTLVIKKWKDYYNQEHTLVKSNEINYANLLNAKDGELAKLRQEISKDKTIIGKTIIQTTTKGVVLVKLEEKNTIVDKLDSQDKKDTLKTKFFNFKDDFLTMSGEFIKDDSLKIEYSVKNEYNIFTKYKSGNLFKKNQIQVEIVNKNTSTVTDKIQVFTIQQPPKKFYETRLFSFIIGAGAGVFINNKINK